MCKGARVFYVALTYIYGPGVLYLGFSGLSYYLRVFGGPKIEGFVCQGAQAYLGRDLTLFIIIYEYNGWV